MKRNMKILFITLTFFSFIFLIWVNLENQGNGFPKNSTDTHPESSQIYFQPGDALYIEYATLEEIRQKSDLIIMGQPFSIAEQRKYGVLLNVKVISTFKGKKLENIKLYRVGGIKDYKIYGDLLDFEKNYIMFLEKVNDGKEDTFSVIGGWQGVFLIDDKGRPFNKHPVIQDEMLKLMKRKIGKKELDALIEFSEGKD